MTDQALDRLPSLLPHRDEKADAAARGRTRTAPGGLLSRLPPADPASSCSDEACKPLVAGRAVVSCP